jgi:hypothetical protein
MPLGDQCVSRLCSEFSQATLSFYSPRDYRAPVPIRPQFGSEFPTLRFRSKEHSGNIKSSFAFLDVLFCSLMLP